MKKIIIGFLFIFTLIGLTSCQKKESSSNPENNLEDNNNSSDKNQISSKGIVVFFSATNHTKQVSSVIANHLGFPTFELVPVEPYSSSDLNYNDSNSRVSKEHNDLNRHTELTSTTISDFDTYQYVFIGYPIWWGEASWVVDDFVKNNEFTGKTVIPFATSASSPLGNSAKNLAAKATGGTWLDGIRFHSSASESEIITWLDGLNLQ